LPLSGSIKQLGIIIGINHDCPVMMSATSTGSTIVNGYLKSVIQTTISSITERLEKIADRIMTPKRRETVQQHVLLFTISRPLLATFLYSQIAFSGTPIVIFILFTIGVFLFSFLSALIVAAVIALAFTGLCVGFALLVLLPTVIVTTFIGVTAWICGWTLYYIVSKWLVKRERETRAKLSFWSTSSVVNDESKKKKAFQTPDE
jgi:Promethin